MVIGKSILQRVYFGVYGKMCANLVPLAACRMHIYVCLAHVTYLEYLIDLALSWHAMRRYDILCVDVEI